MKINKNNWYLNGTEEEKDLQKQSKQYQQKGVKQTGQNNKKKCRMMIWSLKFLLSYHKFHSYDSLNTFVCPSSSQKKKKKRKETSPTSLFGFFCFFFFYSYSFQSKTLSFAEGMCYAIHNIFIKNSLQYKLFGRWIRSRKQKKKLIKTLDKYITSVFIYQFIR